MTAVSTPDPRRSKSGLFLLPFALVIAFFTPALSAQAQGRFRDRIVAEVNGEIITLSETRQAAWGLAQNAKAITPTDSQELARALDGLIDEVLMASAAKDAGMLVDEEAVDRAVVGMMQSLREAFPDEETFLKSLQLIGASVETTRSTFRAHERRRQLGRRILERRVRVTKEEVAVFEKERAKAGEATMTYLLGQILVAVPKSATEEEKTKLRRRAVDLAARVQRTGDFEGVARKSSDDKAIAPRGGSMGWIDANLLRSDVRQAVDVLDNGDITAPLKGPNGFQILLLAGKRDARVMLLEQKLKAERERWLKQLRERGQIRLFAAKKATPKPETTTAPSK